MSDWTLKRQDSRGSFRDDQSFLAAPWAPVEVQDVLMAFPADIGHLLPHPDDIPDEFWESTGTWQDFVTQWFFRGLPADTRAFMREGVDGATAFRHLNALRGSYQPKHEHKAAGMAFLCDKWMHGVETPDKVYGHVPEGIEEQK